jgi:F0F1-type ATP synthase membrane subunit b/b'
MKTTLLAVLFCLLVISSHAETNQEALDAAYEWVERESDRQESRRSASRQQAALEDIRWELAERRRQAQIQEENARRQRERIWAELERQRRLERIRFESACRQRLPR